MDTWLLDRMLVLHHLGVALQLRAAFGHLQTIDNAAVAVQEISARCGRAAMCCWVGGCLGGVGRSCCVACACV